MLIDISTNSVLTTDKKKWPNRCWEIILKCAENLYITTAYLLHNFLLLFQNFKPLIGQFFYTLHFKILIILKLCIYSIIINYWSNNWIFKFMVYYFCLGGDTMMYHNETTHLSSSMLIAVVVAALFVILIIVDVSCFFVNDTGMSLSP